MLDQFESVIAALTQPRNSGATFTIFDSLEQFNPERTDRVGIAQSLNAAFLIMLSGEKRPFYEHAKRFLVQKKEASEWADTAEFYLESIQLIHQEIKDLCQKDLDFSDRLRELADWLSAGRASHDISVTAEKIWSVFFPEATDILADKQKCQDVLRAKRSVRVTSLNIQPVSNPAQDILFTSNVLLTLPPASKSLDELPLSDFMKKELGRVAAEPQLFWYDHPVQIGTEPEKNEVLHGLNGLSQALEFERQRGGAPPDARLTCILSVSVTHTGLHGLANRYLREVLSHSNGLDNMDIYVFTEADTRKIIEKVLAPAAESYLKLEHAGDLLDVFGVDGEYGRHYSFLKAMAAFWKVLIQPDIKATFKIDLDQTFPQEKLVQETGASAFEHFKTPLWGARGLDYDGRPVELGMIAGFLVNAKDLEKSLFTPDVPYPNRALAPDEFVFFSMLPQACSTAAEMMARYNTEKLDGKKTCIQRVHVTGGTNGILVDSLRRHRPFTPSFIGRAEDQAYILSVLQGESERLAYVHKDGLAMSHNKDIFAQEAIQSASVGKLLGDYIRILYFSAYGRVIASDIKSLKKMLDPFTGCFISKIPATVVCLRLALKAASFFRDKKESEGLDFIRIAVKRIREAFNFIQGEDSALKKTYERERLGWDLYYNCLSVIEKAIADNDKVAFDLRKKAKEITKQCLISQK